eukprot:TRINITY_DN12068_c0_g1_i1.p1 TRINITY_DN12068_c0_g1~~TRINITY_DN12068_c0_g1_i1.p1  ORF type:complete len:876 (+),score=228.39 TRINITY_DN12068_c0_g1_i1:58-2628(+)
MASSPKDQAQGTLEALADGPAEGPPGTRDGELLTWVHMADGMRMTFPLQWGIGHTGDHAEDIPGLRPHFVLRDPFGLSVETLLKKGPGDEPEPEEDSSTVDGAHRVPWKDRNLRTLSLFLEDEAAADVSQSTRLAKPRQLSASPSGNMKKAAAADAQSSDVDLRRACRQCLKETLRNERLVEIDGVEDLKQIRVGEKASRNLVIGGCRAFGFQYSLRSGGQQPESYRYLMGTIDPRRRVRVLILVGTANPDLYPSLQKYCQDVVTQHFGSTQNLQLFRPQPPPQDSLELAGELGRGERAKLERGYVRYRNCGAALAFDIPAHAQEWQRGVSLTRAKSVAHVLLLAIRLRVHPTARDLPQGLETSGDEELLAGQRQPVDVSLGIDVEDIVRARHPGILSAAQYAALKMKSVMLEFQNTKPNGAPLTHTIGSRSGVSYVWTGNISSDTRVSNYQKAMCSATINNNKGIVVSFLTKMGQGIFDTNLFLMQDLLKSFRFIPEREADGPFDPCKATIERLQTEGAFRSAFAGKEGGGQTLVARYTFLASCSTAGGAPARSGQQTALLPEERGFGEEEERKGRRKGRAKAAAAEADSDSVIDVSDIPHLTAVAEEVYHLGTTPAPGAEDEEELPPEDEPPEEIPETAESPQPEPEEADAAEVPEDVQEADAGPSPQAAPEAVAEEAAVPEDPPTVEEDEMTAVSMRHLYLKLCERFRCKTNSRFLSCLPTDMVLAATIQELDLSLNYFGNGFAAAVGLLAHMPNLHTVLLDDITLSNEDVRALCGAVASHPCVRHLSLRDNGKVSLASGRMLLGLVRTNPRIEFIDLEGTSIGAEVVDRINAEIAANAAHRDEVAEDLVEDP